LNQKTQSTDKITVFFLDFHLLIQFYTKYVPIYPELHRHYAKLMIMQIILTFTLCEVSSLDIDINGFK